MASAAIINSSENVTIHGGTFTQLNVLGDTSKHGLKLITKSASASAFHDSAANQSPLDMDPDAEQYERIALDWIYQSNNNSTSLMWLAGSRVRTSLIARNIAEICGSNQPKNLLTTFFFSKNDPSRNSTKYFVPTLAYGIIQSIPACRGPITQEVEKDPLILSSSMEKQFDTLILEPLNQLYLAHHDHHGQRTPGNQDSTFPFLIIIHALDECGGASERAQIFRLFERFCTTRLNSQSRIRLPWKVLITSKPDQTISEIFGSLPQSIASYIILPETRERNHPARRSQEERSPIRRNQEEGSSTMRNQEERSSTRRNQEEGSSTRRNQEEGSSTRRNQEERSSTMRNQEERSPTTRSRSPTPTIPQSVSSKTPMPPRELRLLSIDGGGIRGVSALIILEEIMHRLKFLLKLQTPPKPCEVFDLAGGTGTGGLVVIMLFRLRMSARDARDMYVRFMRFVFSERKKWFQGETFKASRLEHAILALISEQLDISSEKAKTEKMVDELCPRCFVCATSTKDTTQPTLFRTWDSQRSHSNVTILDAARATCTIPALFKKAEIANGPDVIETFVDAGYRCNNPVTYVLREAKSLGSTSCVVSLGTGLESIIEFPNPDAFQRLLPAQLLQVFKNIALDCEKTAEETAREFRGKPDFYFRLNVDQGMEDISLDEWEKVSDVVIHTKQYLLKHEVSDKVDKLVNVLHPPIPN